MSERVKLQLGEVRLVPIELFSERLLQLREDDDRFSVGFFLHHYGLRARHAM